MLRRHVVRDHVDVLGHPGLGDRGEGVDADAAFAAFLRQRAGEPGHARLGGGVVRLAVVAEQPREAAGVDDRAATFAVEHVQVDGPRDGVQRLGVHLHHQVPHALLHLEKALVAQDSSVIDEDVDAAEAVERGLENVLTAFDGGDVVVVGDGLTASLTDLVDHLVGHR